MTRDEAPGAVNAAIWRWPGALGHWGLPALFVLTVVSYGVGSRLALQLIEESDLDGVFFIPAGITVAFLLRLPRRSWWVVLLAAGMTEFVMDVSGGFTPAQSSGFALANVVEPLIGAAIVSVTCVTLDLARRRHVGWYALGAVLVGPAVGGAVLGLTDRMFGEDFWATFFQVWLGDALGVVVVGSAILVWGSSPDRRRLLSPWGLILLVGSMVLTVVVLTFTDLPLAFSVLIGVVLTGALFGTRAVAMTSLAISLTLAVFLTTDPGALIIGLTQGEALVLIKLQVGVFALAGLVIAAESNERELAVRQASASAMEAETIELERRREHDLAVQVQRGLLPDRLIRHPAIQVAARYEAAGAAYEVGGDWYDSFTLREGQIGLVVGDIVGHGIEAMTSMGRLRTALAALALRSADPAALLAEVDEFVGGPDGTDFATVFYTIVDPATSQVSYASAGHPPALLISPAGQATWLDQGQTEPLSGDVSVARRSATADIEPGSTLILYSDGLIERRGESLSDGMARLERTASAIHAEDAATICDQLLARLDVGETRRDDVVALVMKVEPAARARYQQVFPARAETLSEIRSSVHRWLRSHEITEPVSEDLLIAVGEATTNVVRHAYRNVEPGDLEVRMALDTSSIDVEITDWGNWLEPHDESDGHLGIGIEMIRKISDGLDIDAGPDGTRLSFRVTLDSHEI